MVRVEIKPYGIRDAKWVCQQYGYEYYDHHGYFARSVWGEEPWGQHEIEDTDAYVIFPEATH